MNFYCKYIANIRLSVVLEILIVLIIILQPCSKFFPVWVYFLVSVLFGIIISIFILFHSYNNIFIIAQLLLLSLVVRNIYYLATHYSVLPYGDPYSEYGVLRALMQNEAIFVFPSMGNLITKKLEVYSGWPAYALLGVFSSRITSINAFYNAFLLPFALFIGWFVITYSLLKTLKQDMGLDNFVINLALLVAATSPFLYQPPLFYHQDLGLFLLTLIFLISYRQIKLHSFQTSILMTLVAISLVIVHHYTSIIAMLYILLLPSLIFIIGMRKYQRFSKITSYVSFLTVGIIMMISIFLWWDNFAPVVWPFVRGRVSNFVNILKTGSFRSAVPHGWETNLSPVLTPNWAPVLLYLRDALTYIPVFMSFILLLIKSENAYPKLFIVSSLLVAAVPLSIDASFGLGVGVVYRAIPLFMPFFALCFGIFYQNFRNKQRRISIILIQNVIVLLVFSSLVGLWAHRWVPLHLYDPRVDFTEAGEHSPSWQRMNKFFIRYVTYNDISQILTDNWYMLSLILPLEQHEKLQSINAKTVSLFGNTMTVSFRGLSVRSYILQILPDKSNPDFRKREFKKKLMTSSNLIYEDGKFRIWRGKKLSRWVYAEKRYHNSIAWKYDELVGIHLPYNYLCIRRWVEDFKTISKRYESTLAVDIGCGTGEVLLSLSKEIDGKIVGIDISEEMIKVVRNKKEEVDTSNISLVIADASYLPFRDKTFDLIYCIATLHHLPDPYQVFVEFSRLLKDNGRVCIEEPLKNALFEFAKNLGIRRFKHEGSPYERAFCLYELQDLVRQNNFTVEKKEFRGYIGLLLATIIKNKSLAVILFKLDNWFSKIPFISKFGLRIFFQLRKKY